MEALDVIILIAGGWVAVTALAMTLLTAARRADEAGQASVQEPAGHWARMPRMPGAGASNFRVST